MFHVKHFASALRTRNAEGASKRAKLRNPFAELMIPNAPSRTSQIHPSHHLSCTSHTGKRAEPPRQTHRPPTKTRRNQRGRFRKPSRNRNQNKHLHQPRSESCNRKPFRQSHPKPPIHVVTSRSCGIQQRHFLQPNPRPSAQALPPVKPGATSADALANHARSCQPHPKQPITHEAASCTPSSQPHTKLPARALPLVEAEEKAGAHDRLCPKIEPLADAALAQHGDLVA